MYEVDRKRQRKERRDMTSPFQPFNNPKVTNRLMLEAATPAPQEQAQVQVQVQASDEKINAVIGDVYQTILQLNQQHANTVASLIAYADYLRSIQQQRLAPPVGQPYARETVDDLLFGPKSKPLTREDEFYAALTTHHQAILPQPRPQQKDVTSYPTLEVPSL
jgi:hypothetical protein